MKSSHLVVLGFVLALSGGVWLMQSGDASAPAPGPVGQDRVDEPRPLSDELDSNSASAGAEREESLSEGLARVALGEVEEPTGPSRTFALQVWNRKKGEPAVRATVHFMTGGDRGRREDRFAPHISEVAETEGRKFTTDETGRVQLPPVDRWGYVTAELDGAFGFSLIRRNHRDVETVILQPDETVTVRVVDDEGRAVADAPVGVLQRIPVRQDPKKLWGEMERLKDQMTSVRSWMDGNPANAPRGQARMESLMQRIAETEARLAQMKRAGAKGGKGARGAPQSKPAKQAFTDRLDVRARRRTDRDGVAVFRHFQVYRNGGEKWWPQTMRSQFEAGLLVAASELESVPFAGQPVPGDVIELRMPQTGTLALRTVDRDGRPFTHPVHATVSIPGVQTPWQSITVRKEQDEQFIEFPFVGVGMELNASCRLDDNDFRWRMDAFLGPRSKGERHEVDLVVAPDAGMLFGRVVDAAGTPLAGAKPTFLINSHRGRLEGEGVILDRDGRFHLPYEVRSSHRAPFRFELRDERAEPPRGMAMPLPGLPEAAVTDVGELVVGALPPLAWGTVVNDLGEPLSGARVQLQRERDVGRRESEVRFVDEAFVETRTNEAGEFELFGELEAVRYRLRVETGGHFRFDSPALRAGERFDVELIRHAKLIGTVMLPEWIKASQVKTRLEPMNPDGGRRRDDRIRDYRGKQYIYFDSVRPGLYSVSVRLDDYPDPFLRIDNVSIEAGGDGVHPRLTDLDLTNSLFRYEVSAVDETGQPFNPGMPLLARVARLDGSSTFVGIPWKSQTVEVLSAQPQLEVVPLARQHRAERTFLAQGQQQIRFVRVPPAELELPGARSVLGDMPVRVLLTPAGEAGGLPAELSSWDERSRRIAGWYGKTRVLRGNLSPRDVVRFSSGQPGTYRVQVQLAPPGIKPITVSMGQVVLPESPSGAPVRAVGVVDVEVLLDGRMQVTEAQQGR